MKCKKCGNKRCFVMVKEIGEWNNEKKRFENITDPDEYIVCDICGSFKVDTEEDY